MTLTQFARLPPAVLLLVVIMLWPAIWAGAGLTTALAADIGRLVRRRRDFGSSLVDKLTTNGSKGSPDTNGTYSQRSES